MPDDARTSSQISAFHRDVFEDVLKLGKDAAPWLDFTDVGRGSKELLVSESAAGGLILGRVDFAFS